MKVTAKLAICALLLVAKYGLSMAYRTNSGYSGRPTSSYTAQKDYQALEAVNFLPQPNDNANTPKRASPPEVAKFRNEENFYYAQALKGQELPRQENLAPTQENFKSLPPALFSHKVLHVLPAPRYPEDFRQRRYTDVKSAYNATTNATLPVGSSNIDHKEAGKRNKVQDHHGKPSQQETRHFHDIYMRFGGSPQSITAYGHVESRPELFEQRFATLNKGNRYKGEVKWADKTGGYGEHRWDMAQGKLS